MIAVIQRVRRASVTVEDQVIFRIRQGLVVLVGVARGDTGQDVNFMVEKSLAFEFFQTQKVK